MSTVYRGPRWRPGREDGRITVFFAILAPAFLALLGLVVDGGAKIRALQRADNIAAEAARAAGQTIKAGQAIGGGAKEIDPAHVTGVVRAYLAAIGDVTGTVVVTGPQQLTVTVTTRYHPIVLGAFGAHAATVRGEASIVLVAQ